MNKELLRMQMLAGVITESQYKRRLNEAEIPNQLKQTIQQEYPEIVQNGKIEQGTEEWVFLLKLVLESMYDGKYKRFFDGIDEYDLFINGEYESYYDMIKNTVNESMFEVTDLESLLDEMDTSDLIDAVAEAMGGNSANAQDMQKAKNALLAYGVNELDDFSYVDNLEQALEELGVKII